MSKHLSDERKAAMAKGRAALLESVREAREKDLLVVKDQKGGVWHLFRFDSMNFAIVRHWKRDGEMVEDDPLFYPTFQDAVYGLFRHGAGETTSSGVPALLQSLRNHTGEIAAALGRLA